LAILEECLGIRIAKGRKIKDQKKKRVKEGLLGKGRHDINSEE
jgi:hypothetical protein